jgi:hypothetical protein
MLVQRLILFLVLLVGALAFVVWLSFSSADGVQGDLDSVRLGADAGAGTSAAAEEAGGAKTLEGPESRETRSGVELPIEGFVELRGRVLDDSRTPVPSARVKFVDPYGPGVEARTDVSGKYSLSVSGGEFGLSDLVLLHRGSVFASDEQGRAGAVALDRLPSEGPEEQEGYAAPDLILGAARPLQVEVHDQGRVIADARVWVEVGMDRRLCASELTDEAGTVVLAWVPEGPLFVSAGHAELVGRRSYREAERPQRVLVELGPGRSVQVRVLEYHSGRPLAGIRLGVESRDAVGYAATWGDPWQSPSWRRLSMESPPTDLEGRTRLEGLPQQSSLQVVVTDVSANKSLRSGLPEPIPAEFAGELEIRLPVSQPRTWRVPVEAGELPVPPDGSRIQFARSISARTASGALPTSGHMIDGVLVIRGPEGAPAREFML